MPGTLSRADLLADIEASLSDAKEYCEGRYEAFLAAAVTDFTRVRPRTLIGHADLVAGQSDYPVPADFYDFKVSDWGVMSRSAMQPWQANYPRFLPSATVLDTQPKTIRLSPAPSAEQIVALGSNYSYFYFANHEVGAEAEQTTIRLADRDLLILRAQVEAMRHIAFRTTGKSNSTRAVVSGQPKVGHPAALAEQLMAEFERRLGC